MKDLVNAFPAQLSEALTIADKARLKKIDRPIRNVLITGLGGSGIGGTIFQDITSKRSPVPILVNKEYFIPAFVDEHTLVIVSSYSGNTEETLSAFKIALEKKAQIICISSGGEVVELAKKYDLDYIQIPGGNPPRAALAYSLVQLIRIGEEYGLCEKGTLQKFNEAVGFLKKEWADVQEKTKELAKSISNTIPVIYTVAGYEGIAVRMRQQINENGKMLCWHHVIPEMNHNELVGWKESSSRNAVIILRNTDDFDRVQTRIGICKEIIQNYTDNIQEVFSKGNNEIERMLYFIVFGDWLSVFLAEEKGVDPTEVRVIDHLKGELAKK